MQHNSAERMSEIRQRISAGPPVATVTPASA